ncbi:MAG: VCBS repeat-containing protein [Candidatus Riflebacteria bacterium]|nr:VCBS repeat-containing protein [Candidatus Riflebacteria bacterium]
MQQSIKGIVFIACFIFFVFTGIPALYSQSADGPTFPEVSGKVTGDIYGQIQVFDDIDGDGKKDLVFGATDGQVHVFSSATGKEIMSGLWPKHTGGPILSSVTVADLQGDGHKDVIVGSYDGKVYGLNTWGKELWTVDTHGTISQSSPEVADVEGDGVLNIFVGSKSGSVFRIDNNGRMVWAVPMTTKVSAGVVTADIDGDGKKEIICKDDSGKVTVLNLSGTPRNGWPQTTTENQEWPFEVGTADLGGDGPKEIFTTTPNKQLVTWNNAGQLISRFPLTDGAHGAPRVADLMGDGKLEYVIAQADGSVSVLDRNGKSLPGFPFKTGHSIYSSPQIIDIDGDGRLDIVFTAWNPEGSGKESGYIMAVGRDGRQLPGFPKYIGKCIAPLTFADLDGDGCLEMIAAGGINYTDSQLHIFPTKAHVQIKMALLGTEVSF